MTAHTLSLNERLVSRALSFDNPGSPIHDRLRVIGASCSEETAGVCGMVYARVGEGRMQGVVVV